MTDHLLPQDYRSYCRLCGARDRKNRIINLGELFFCNICQTTTLLRVRKTGVKRTYSRIDALKTEPIAVILQKEVVGHCNTNQISLHGKAFG